MNIVVQFLFIVFSGVCRELFILNLPTFSLNYMPDFD